MNVFVCLCFCCVLVQRVYCVYACVIISLAMCLCMCVVRDADGEFLLAEAALHLPQWVTPRAALRRVLLADGRVLLVPRPTRPDQLLLTPPALLQHAAVEAAAAADRRAAMALPPRAWAAVQKRVLRAAAASAQRHVCGATLPMAAAHVLQTPCLVAAAVRYYAQRDVVSMAALRRMHMFAAVDAPMVTVPIRLTRQLYAMLMHGTMVSVIHVHFFLLLLFSFWYSELIFMGVGATACATTGELKPPPRSGFVLPPVDRIVERRYATPLLVSLFFGSHFAFLRVCFVCANPHMHVVLCVLYGFWDLSMCILFWMIVFLLLFSRERIYACVCVCVCVYIYMCMCVCA